MIAKQIDFIKKFHDDLLVDRTKSKTYLPKYKTGNSVLSMHDMSQDQWMELVSLHDYHNLWRDAGLLLEKI